MESTHSPVWRRHGDQLASDPGQWEFHARLLFAGARACHERYVIATAAIKESDMPHGDLVLSISANYLAAQVIEVLLKALALRREPDSAINGRLYTHDLVTLANDVARIPISIEEEKRLIKVGQIVMWAGRYPTPKWDKERSKKAHDLPQGQTADGAVSIDMSAFPTSIGWDALEEMLQKLWTAWAAGEQTSSAG